MDALTCPHCGLSILQNPELSATTWLCSGCQGLVSRTGQSQQHVEIRQDPTGNQATSLLLPIGVNGWAIAASYVALFPCVIPLAPIFGFIALRRLKKNPYQRGKVRSWFAILLGSFWIAMTVFLVVSSLWPKKTPGFENTATRPKLATTPQVPAKPKVASKPISLEDVGKLWAIVRSPGRTKLDYEQARQSARLAAARFPENGLVLRTIGVADYRCGSAVSAILNLKAARKLNAKAAGHEDPIDIAFLAMCAHSKGRKEEALKGRALVMKLMESNAPAEGDTETAAIVKEMEEFLATPPPPPSNSPDGAPPPPSSVKSPPPVKSP